MVSFPGKILQNFRKTPGLIVWLLKTGCSGRERSVAGIVVYGFLGVGLYAFSFALLIAYARFQIDGQAASIRGIVVQFPPGMPGVLYCAAGAFFLGILSGSCTYLGQKGILKITRLFHYATVEKTLVLYRQRLFRQQLDNLEFLTRQHGLQHLPSIYCNYLAISLKIVLEAIQPLLTLVFTLLVLFYLNFRASLLLLPVVTLYLAVISGVGRKAVSLQGDYLSRLAKVNPRFMQFFTFADHNSSPVVGRDFPGRLLEDVRFDDILYPFYERILVTFRSAYFSHIFLTVSTVGLFIIFALKFEDFKTSWSSIIVYLLALRFCGQSFKKLSTLFVSLSRFFPVIRVYHAYLVDDFPAEKTADCKGSGLSDLSMRFFDFVKTGKRGVSFLLWLPFGTGFSLNKERKRWIMNASGVEDSGTRELHFYTRPEFIQGLTPLQLFAGVESEVVESEELNELFEALGVLTEIRQLENGFSTILTETVWKSLSRELAFALGCGYPLVHSDAVVVIDLKMFFPLSLDFQREFLKRVAGQQLVISSENIDSMIKFFVRQKIDDQAQTLIVTDEHCLELVKTRELKELQDALLQRSTGMEKAQRQRKAERAELTDAVADELFM